MNIGWGKQINATLNDYDLPSDFNTIKNTPPTEWKNKVRTVIEKKNQERLHQECHKKIEESLVEKTKTKWLVDQLTNTYYKRGIPHEITNATKQETKTIISARFGMLECGQNFQGTLNQLCNRCDTIDNEHHRLNNCIRWRDINLYDTIEKVDFNMIYSNDIDVLRPILTKNETAWNTCDHSTHPSSQSDFFCP